MQQPAIENIITAPLALAGLSLDALHEMNDTPLDQLPYHLAIAWTLYCELDREKRLTLFRTQAINALEDSLTVMSTVDLDSVSEASRQDLQGRIEETRRLYIEILKRADKGQE